MCLRFPQILFRFDNPTLGNRRFTFHDLLCFFKCYLEPLYIFMRPFHFCLCQLKLCLIVNRIKLCIRNTDFLSRYGGEEFAIILPGTNREGACIVAEKVRRAIEMTRFYFQNQAIPVTISLGVTEVREADPEPETVFARADDAMYRAKREGRNRVCAL